MNTIEQLEQQAAAMQVKLDEMKATIALEKAEASKKVVENNLFGMDIPDMGSDYHYISSPLSEGSSKTGCSIRSGVRDSNYKFAFTDESKCERMAEAFQVLLELRQCEGVVAGMKGESQYLIEMDKLGKICIENYTTLSGYLSPFFSSKELAQKAIDTVGHDRIQRAFNTMQGVFGEQTA